MYVPYKKAMQYRDEHCLPRFEVIEDGREIICTMQDLLYLQIKKLLQTYPQLKKTMENIKKLHPAAIFVLVFKYGMYAQEIY